MKEKPTSNLQGVVKVSWKQTQGRGKAWGLGHHLGRPSGGLPHPTSLSVGSRRLDASRLGLACGSLPWQGQSLAIWPCMKTCGYFDTTQMLGASTECSTCASPLPQTVFTQSESSPVTRARGSPIVLRATSDHHLHVHTYPNWMDVPHHSQIRALTDMLLIAEE